MHTVCAGYKVIAIQLSAAAPVTLVLDGDAAFARVLKQYNAAALDDVPSDSATTHAGTAHSFGVLVCGEMYRPAPRAAPAPYVCNVLLSCELLPPSPGGGTRQAHFFDCLTNRALEKLLRLEGAAGVSVSRHPTALVTSVERMTDGGTYFLAPGGTGDVPLTAKVANVIGHNTNVATGFGHEAAECVRGIVAARHAGADVRRARDKIFVTWHGKQLEVDGVVYIQDGPCAYVIESENVLSEASGDELQKRLDAINSVKDAAGCPQELCVFAGKQVYGVLCGRSIQLKQAPPTRFASTAALVEDWKAHGYKLLLPSGAALGSGVFSASEFLE